MSDINFDHNYQSSDRKSEVKTAFFNGRFFTTLNLTPNLYLNSFVRVEEETQNAENIRRSQSFDGGGDRAFENQGAKFEELVLVYDQKDFGFLIGKYTLNYGKAWLQGRGIWNHQISNNYRQRNNLGFGGVYRIGDRENEGEYNFGFNIFTADRKNLDGSIVTKNDSFSKSEARAGDSRNFNSFAASLDINYDFGEREKLNYHFAYLNADVNDRVSTLPKNKIDSQKGFLANIKYQYPLSKNFDLDGLLEYADEKNIDGDSDNYQDFLISSLVLRYKKNYNLTIGGARFRDIKNGENGTDRIQSEISIGYDFDKTILFDRLILQIGYKNLRIDNKSSLDSRNTCGILLRYLKDF
jgi:hypothetical protein